MSVIQASRNQAEENRVYFHPKQVEWIEKQFPERYIPSTASEAELREYMGTRLVVHCIKDRCKA